MISIKEIFSLTEKELDSKLKLFKDKTKYLNLLEKINAVIIHSLNKNLLNDEESELVESKKYDKIMELMSNKKLNYEEFNSLLNNKKSLNNKELLNNKKSEKVKINFKNAKNLQTKININSDSLLSWKNIELLIESEKFDRSIMTMTFIKIFENRFLIIYKLSKNNIQIYEANLIDSENSFFEFKFEIQQNDNEIRDLNIQKIKENQFILSCKGSKLIYFYKIILNDNKFEYNFIDNIFQGDHILAIDFNINYILLSNRKYKNLFIYEFDNDYTSIKFIKQINIENFITKILIFDNYFIIYSFTNNIYLGNIDTEKINLLTSNKFNIIISILKYEKDFYYLAIANSLNEIGIYLLNMSNFDTISSNSFNISIDNDYIRSISMIKNKNNEVNLVCNFDEGILKIFKINEDDYSLIVSKELLPNKIDNNCSFLDEKNIIIYHRDDKIQIYNKN
jgi:hypothetical protein